MDDFTHVVRFPRQLNSPVFTVDQPIVVFIPLGQIVTGSRGEVLLQQANYILELEQYRKHPHGRFPYAFEFARLWNRRASHVILAISHFVIPDEFC